MIAEEIPAKVSADKAYQNAMKNSDRQNARIEHDKALQRVIVELLADHAELFKQFSDNPSFKKWLGDTNFMTTYAPAPSIHQHHSRVSQTARGWDLSSPLPELQASRSFVGLIAPDIRSQFTLRQPNCGVLRKFRESGI